MSNNARAVTIARAVKNAKNRALYRYEEDVAEELASLAHLNDAQREKYFQIATLAFREGIETFVEELERNHLGFAFTS